MKAPEYHEGPEARERFGKTMTALFRAPGFEFEVGVCESIATRRS
jgi:hypothetical protein